MAQSCSSERENNLRARKPAPNLKVFRAIRAAGVCRESENTKNLRKVREKTFPVKLAFAWHSAEANLLIGSQFAEALLYLRLPNLRIYSITELEPTRDEILFQPNRKVFTWRRWMRFDANCARWTEPLKRSICRLVNIHSWPLNKIFTFL